MRFRNIGNWKNIDNLRGILFFAQRLDELTYPYTLDSYKSPTMSIQGLTREAVRLIDESLKLSPENREKSLNSCQNVISELKLRMRGNWIAKSVCSIDVENLLGIELATDNADKTKRNLELLRAEIDSEEYLIKIVESVILLADKSNKKERLDLLAKEFVSFLQYRGVSRDHININVVDFFFSDAEFNSAEQFKIFCKAVYPHLHKFRVVLSVHDIINSLDEDILYRNNCAVIDGPIERISEEILGEFREKTKASCLLLSIVEATDYNAAVSRAIARVDTIYNFYRIFNHKEQLETSRHALAEQSCCEGILKPIEAPKNHMHFIKDMRSVKASSTLKRFHDSIAINTGPDANKFRNLLNLHSIGLNSNSEYIQVVNLWTCLETMAPGDQGKSKISNVVNKIIPMLMLGYYNRLVVNLLFDILRWNRVALRKSFKSAHCKNGDIKSKFVSLLADPANESARSDFYIHCRDFELLRFRFYSMAKLFASPTVAYEKLLSHENMIRWQLHRIYRTRNRIVHAGASPDFTGYLVENAHDFFDQSLLFCLELSARKPGFNKFLTCFDYADIRYNEYKSDMKSGNSKLVWTVPDAVDGSYVLDA